MNSLSFNSKTLHDVVHRSILSHWRATNQEDFTRENPVALPSHWCKGRHGQVCPERPQVYDHRVEAILKLGIVNVTGAHGSTKSNSLSDSESDSISVTLAQEVSITIQEIIADQRISGRVEGLASQDYLHYKVIVYIHTDQWYIHPYAGQDEGRSWASIQAGGKWQIPTVQREFKADKVTALLVKKNYPEPNKADNLEKIQHAAMVIKELRGTPDYGKL